MKRYKHIEELKEAYESKKPAIRRRLREFKQVPKEKYFYELLYCLMTPQSSAVNAGKAQAMFESLGFINADIDPEQILSERKHYIRFHKTKAKWIMRMKEQFDEIEDIIAGNSTAFEKRIWLAEHVMGFSLKEATHFLRNIGKNDGLAILDRHIIKNLRYHGVIRSVPKTITKKVYLNIEKKFLQFSDAIGISVDELDLVFWSKEAGEILK
ncbi:MAG: N-glycosylase/DNA lyase [Ignavibacteriales bacterium]|nr:N-glycosylase/DNA lyase [Ignavibacteriales bacterium]